MLSVLLSLIYLLNTSPDTAMTPEPKEAASTLQYLIQAPKKTTGKHKAVLLLHGVGSNEQDLFGLASRMPDDFYVISARGPITLGTNSYAWYEVDFSSGKPVFNHAQEERSRKMIVDFIQQVKAKYGIGEMYIAGFSQGAIMSYSIGLTNPGLVVGVVGLSGRILNEIRPAVHAGNLLAGLRVMIAHGTSDATLPISYAREAKEYLQNLGVQLSYHEYEMGHQITDQVVQDINSFLRR
jgi:phospholipase/carboxylesterase